MNPPGGDVFDQIAGANASSTQPQAQGGEDVFDKIAASGSGEDSPPSTDPSVTGEITNDVGNKVIVPKDGEEFGDTLARAVSHYRSMSPQERTDAYRKELATAPAKAGETLAAAPLLGFGGGAGLASPLELHSAMTAGFKALLPAVTSGVVGLGNWAEAHPVAAKALWEGLKVVMMGTAAGAGARIAGRVIKAAPGE